MLSFAIALHIVAVTIWVGGMFFAYFFLRPAAASILEPPQRLRLWQSVFKRFFYWVWVAVVILPVSGHYLAMQFGALTNWSHHIIIMMMLAYSMIVLFIYVYFILYKKFCLAVSQQKWPSAAQYLNKIRQIIALNLTLGLITIISASAGRYLT
jgi:uncharacterized membrane protein